MQRTLTFIGFVMLFAIGVLIIAGGAASSSESSYIPTEPLAVIILLGAVLAVLVLTVITGIGLAQAFGLLSKQVSTPLDPEDRPKIEKALVGRADRLGSQASSLLKRVGYGDSEAVAPYVPTYSYQAASESTEARQFTLAVGLTVLGLLGYAAYSQGQNWIEAAQKLDLTVWAIGIGSTILLLGATGATGVGLSVWFFRTHEEQVKAAQLKEPAWPAGEVEGWEAKVKGLPQTVRQMTFLDLSLIGLNVLLGLVLLGSIAAFVVPGLITVAEVDQLLNPPPTEAAGPVAASAVPAEVQAEFDALPAGDAASGETIFARGVPETAAPACITCHDITSNATNIGPSQLGIASRAGSRKSGYGAEVYLYESITRPNAFITPGFTEGLMPEVFADALSPQEIADVIAYLMTLE